MFKIHQREQAKWWRWLPVTFFILLKRPICQYTVL